ncbi:MAG TPA: protein kinase, partial [Gemmatimonadaceae bacterium]
MPVVAGPDPGRSSASSSRRWAKVLSALVLLAGLAPAIAEAQEWHELYAEGKQALRNGQVERAAQRFRAAIQKRPQPGVSVPTYGTNFEPQYFPYLRLAEAYLRLEDYDNALKTLETSARLGVEPAAERTALETRARAALDAKRVAPQPVRLPPATRPPDPVISQPKSTLPTTTPKRDSFVSPPETARAAPPTAAMRTPEPNRAPPRAPELDLTTQPPGARVFIDDEPIGRSDPQTGRLRLTTLRPGRHRLRLSADGYDDLVRDIVLANDPVAFHGVLSTTQPTTPDSELQNPLTQPNSPRLRWWWLVLVPAVLVPTLWFSRARLQKRPHALVEIAKPATPTPTPVRTESSSLENFPVEFGDYRLIRRIGKGGMATVYEAERRGSGEKLALKRPLSGFLDDRRFLERFAHEAELGRALHHPNIVRIVDRGQVESTPYFAMELIDGETLRDRLDREGRLDPALAASVTARVAEALDYAHHKGVIHRD